MTGKQLRNSILQWAIQGKLVPQDPTDEPASVLLERIRAEKERLIKGKKIKRDKNESVIFRGEDNSYYEKFSTTGEVKCIDNEIPFDLPQGWEWCRLGSILNIWSARRVHEKDWQSNGIPFYRAREIGKLADYGGVNNELFIDHQLYNEFSKSGVPEIGDLMMTAVGTLGKTYIVESTKPFYFKDGSVLCVGNRYKINPYYLKSFFESPVFSSQYLSESDGTTVATLTMVRLNKYLIPIPSVSEQQRIVKKIEELKPLLHLYGKSVYNFEILNNGINEKLKKSIIQEAIQGRLVPQIESEGTADELLEEIRSEKKRLVKEGKLKASVLKEESRIFKGEDNKYYEQIGSEIFDISEEISFDIPASWRFSRLGNIANLRLGKTPPRGEKEYWQPGIYPWVSIADMKDGETIFHTKETISKEGARLLQNIISPAGSLIMSFKLTIGKISILGMDAFHNEAIITIRPYIINHEWFLKLLPMIAQTGSTKDAIKGRTLNSKSLNALLIPIPPLPELCRIIASLEEISDYL